MTEPDLKHLTEPSASLPRQQVGRVMSWKRPARGARKTFFRRFLDVFKMSKKRSEGIQIRAEAAEAARRITEMNADLNRLLEAARKVK